MSIRRVTALGGVVGVQGGQDEVPGQRGLDRDLRGFAIANLADEKDIRILTHDRPQRRREREAGLFVHLHLYDSGQPVFDRILDRHDVQPAFLELAQCRVQAWWSCHCQWVR